MKKVIEIIRLIGVLISYIMLLTVFSPSEAATEIVEIPISNNPESELKKQAYDLLKAKCNVCHRKQNPFKIFSLRNMNKHAPKIYQQVFIKKSMPKGDTIQLTEEEYQVLNSWLHSQNIK